MSGGVREARLELSGATVHYREAGRGLPVLLVPGLGLSGRFYAPLLPAFAAAGLRVVVPDPPGFGRTPGPALGSSVGGLADFHLAFAAALGLGPAVWVGHSVGAQVAIRTAAHGDVVRGLVLAAPSGAPARLLRLRQLGALALTAFRVRPALVGSVLREYVANSPVRVTATWLRAARDRPARHAAAVAAPTLVLVGGRDPVPGGRYLDLLRQRLPEARFQVVPGATHALPRDAADTFVRAVADFTREVFADGAGAEREGPASP